jgi:hypothetical protein
MDEWDVSRRDSARVVFYIRHMSKDENTAHCRELGILLRGLRDEAKLEAKTVAAAIGWTTVKISRVETGKQKITDADAAAYAVYCGAVGERLMEILDFAREVQTDHRFRRYHGELPEQLRSLMIEESSAAHIASYEAIYLPGLAQTEDYARALTSGEGMSKKLVDTRVQARMARQGLIKRERPTQCRFLIHENALRLPVGSPTIMFEQLLHLLFLDSRPQCEVHVIPREAGQFGAAPHSFRIMTYADHAPIIYLHTLTGGVFFEKQPDIDAYRAELKRIDAVALDQPRSRDMLMRVASEYELMGDSFDDHT